jgi:hypothetical protein
MDLHQAAGAAGGRILAAVSIQQHGGRQHRSPAALPKSNRWRLAACPPARPGLFLFLLCLDQQVFVIALILPFTRLVQVLPLQSILKQEKESGCGR